MINLYKMLDIVPLSVKLEIVKEELLKLYNSEKKLVENGKFIDDFFVNELESQYNDFLDLVNYINFDDELKCELYIWAKTKRKELNLEDNIFNVSSFSIEEEDRFDNANEIINKQNNFRIK